MFIWLPCARRHPRGISSFVLAGLSDRAPPGDRRVLITDLQQGPPKASPLSSPAELTYLIFLRHCWASILKTGCDLASPVIQPCDHAVECR
jgi:hypothetical protein